ncbi:ABC transporter ATP-binding protein [Streptomyces profundus]|uniref:ABC transporter ATP-binding protein n=1 Tax=Streptomyces profundus TaxID=2867410 RepID=UPI001D16296E|nr:ABC transporter ATP-binding protein [Streptomyces sp. MA3_2.13]UED83308.1 ABC transporter ATP-binding protein/permease [Streptomyces sp. MA3_2.13]
MVSDEPDGAVASAEPAAGRPLPVAGRARVRRAALRLMRADRRALLVVLTLNVLAAGAGLVGPWLLGRVIDEVRAGAGVGTVDRLALFIVLFALLQLLLARWARLRGHRYGERILARVREEFVERALALPSATVERAGAGDLAARGTGDVAVVGRAMRDAAPEVLVAGMQALLLLGAVFVVSPLLGACGVLGMAGVWVASRWYLRRARAAYLAEGGANSAHAELIEATAAGARTVEALGLGPRRIAASRSAIDVSVRSREATLRLRTVLFPSVDIAHIASVTGVLLLGGALYRADALGLGAVVTAVLYLWQLEQPLATVLRWMEQLQSGAASFARVEGVATAVGAPSVEDFPEPDGRSVRLAGVRFAYPGGDEVLRGVDLDVRPGERLAVVGPSGAGKSTLARLLAGIETPDAGTVTVGGVPPSAVRPERLRRHIVLVTQEHHVFLGTVADNLRIAAPTADAARLAEALDLVGADWWAGLPRGLDTELGPGGHRPDAAQAQQLALARVVLADPHTVILDEATASLDPGGARRAERALAAVLRGRTVIAIAHRLHTARDADRIAVLVDGRLTELGSHAELLAAGRTYAALWRSWRGTPPPG